MLLGTKQRLEEQVVLVLAKAPGITAKKLLSIICSKFQQVSIQALYQKLSSLEENGIVSKVKDRYSLRLAWIFEMSSLMDSAYEEFIRTTSLETIFLRGQKRQRWKFTSLSKLIAFYSQLVLVLSEHSEDKAIYDWTAHVWYHFAHREDETQVLRTLKLAGARYYLAVSGNTYLDRTYLDFFNLADGEIAFGVDPFSNPSTNASCVVGEYVCSVSFDRLLAEKLENLYQTIGDDRQTDFGSVVDIVTSESTVWLKVEHDPELAHRQRRKFKRFFGLS